MSIHRYIPRFGAALALALAFAVGAHAQSHGDHPEESSEKKPVQAQGARAQPAESAHSAMDHGGMQHGASHAVASRPPPDHVPPPAPTHEMGPMSPVQMVDVMGMDDRAMFGLFALDRFERVKTGDGYATSWSAQGWLGGDFDKLHVRSEGSRANGAVEHADLELLWGHAIAPFWDSQLGVRRDFGRGPDRGWVAFGVQGLAPYWFEIAATAYVGEQDRTALRAEVDYELLLTQRLVLQPRVELNAYGRADPALRIGSGLSDTSFGLRLRYEIRREFAPYVGVEWTKSFGATADFAREDGHDVTDLRWVAGVRVWF
ncbi:copper resistance protein B [Dokdonella soli]|uniref:Copper resistance protein B n=1 Tax=Dokdonella soli TaxID=529810 RepID=A0ABP3TTP1_9GAMM